MAETRKIVLDVIEAIGGCREFWDKAPACQIPLSRAIQILQTHLEGENHETSAQADPAAIQA